MNLRCQRCDWRPDPDADEDRATQFDAHAVSAGHPRCICCGQSLTEHEPQVCEQDLTSTRADLALIVTLWAELPAHLGQPSGQTFGRRGGDEHTLPGGTIMAMLGPGNDGHRPRQLTKLDRERGEEGREHSIDNDPSDPPSVHWSLLSWALDWAEARDDTLDPTFDGVAGYLEVQSRWAANTHDAFDSYATEMRSLRLQLEAVTGRTRKPTKAGASCFECGNDLVRRVIPYTAEATVYQWWVPGAEGPLPAHLIEPTERTGEIEEDHATCSACREQYTEARYRLACRNAAQDASRIDVEGEAYATPESLGRELQRSPHTLRVWAQRDGLCSWVQRGGVVFVHVDGVTAAHDERKTRRRTA